MRKEMNKKQEEVKQDVENKVDVNVYAKPMTFAKKKEANSENTGKKVANERKTCFLLWKAPSGKCFFGVAKDHDGNDLGKVIAFENHSKKNEKEPDFRIYWLDDDGKRSKEEVASLWKNVTAKNLYLTGKTNEGERLFGFFNKPIEGKKVPNISIYYNVE